jgi:hypothetical protein
LVTTADAQQWLATEDAARASTRFAAVDELLITVTTAALAGRSPLRVTGLAEQRMLVTEHLSMADCATLTAVFDPEAQRATGAWWLPETAALTPGLVNLPAYYGTEPRWAMNIASTLSGRLRLIDSPAALACWALPEFRSS